MYRPTASTIRDSFFENFSLSGPKRRPRSPNRTDGILPSARRRVPHEKLKPNGHLAGYSSGLSVFVGVAPPAPVSASPPGSPLSWGEAYLSARLMAEAQDRIRTSWDRRGILKPRHGCLCRREAPASAKTAPIFGARRTRGP